MDDLKYLVGQGCYWKKRAPDMDTTEVVDLESLFHNHDEEHEDMYDLEIIESEEVENAGQRKEKTHKNDINQ